MLLLIWSAFLVIPPGLLLILSRVAMITFSASSIFKGAFSFGAVVTSVLEVGGCFRSGVNNAKTEEDAISAFLVGAAVWSVLSGPEGCLRSGFRAGQAQSDVFGTAVSNAKEDGGSNVQEERGGYLRSGFRAGHQAQVDAIGAFEKKVSVAIFEEM